MLTVVRYTTIMLCALALSLGLTQALAAEPDPMLLAAVSALLSTAAASALVLAIMLRARPGFGLAAWGTFVLALSGALWAMLMVPGRQPEWLIRSVARWPAGIELGHLLQAKNAPLFALSAWLLGFSLIVLSAIRRPVVRRAERGPLPLFGRIVS